MDYIKNLKEMINSCFTYGGAGVDSYNYKTYILKYKDNLGEDVFTQVYNEHLQYLTDNATVQTNVYTDCEGLSYNNLVIK